MLKCQLCGNPIDGTTDDNYNKDHSKIQCPHCNQWFLVAEVEGDGGPKPAPAGTIFVEKDGFPFVGVWNGTTVVISVPAHTGNDWRSKGRFIDLPYMMPETLDKYIEALQEIRKKLTVQSDKGGP